MGKLRIHCINVKNGCKEILLLDKLDNHQKSCRFDKKTCGKCFCDQSVNHDCIRSLLESKQKLIQTNEEDLKELKEKLKLSTEMNISMKSEIANYLQTIQDMSNANQPKVGPSITREVYSNSLSYDVLYWVTTCVEIYGFSV